MTPILGILVAIGCGLALVAVAIIIVLRIRPTSVYAGRKGHHGVGGGGYSGTHVPLNQRELDECIDMEETKHGEPDVIPVNKGA